MNEPFATTYDEVPYPGGAHPQTHPDRLAAVGRLYGLAPPEVETCRVLEIGCAEGANIIPMAYAMPKASFVGADLSRRQLDTGRERIAALGLSNIELRFGDVASERARGAHREEFDFIIVHGVYSWVAPEVRRRVLEVTKASLAPRGLAYISYNALPGGHQRRMIREMLLYHTRSVCGAAECVESARWFLGLLSQSVPASLGGYAQMINDERAAVAEMRDDLVFHDLLEEHNEPEYLYEFVAETERQGLRYVAESNSLGVRGAPLGATAVGWANEAARGSAAAREQYLDFVRWRSFRQSVLCHSEANASEQVVVDAVRRLRVTSRAACLSSAPDLITDKPEEFRAPGDITVGTNHPLTKAALVSLSSLFPAAVTFDELVVAAVQRLAASGAPSAWAPSPEDLTELAESLCAAFAEGVVELHAWKPPLATAIGDRSEASRVARLQAEHAPHAVNLWHETHALDPISRRLLCMLDGKHDRSQMVDQLDRDASAGELVVQFDGRAVDEPRARRRLLDEGIARTIESLARAAFLVA